MVSPTHRVIHAKAHYCLSCQRRLASSKASYLWMPACAGMTNLDVSKLTCLKLRTQYWRIFKKCKQMMRAWAPR